MSFDGEARQAILAHLSPDEHLLWAGRPRRGLRLQASDILAIPASLLWTGFVVFWESMVIRSGAPLLFQLWGVPFLVAGAYIVVGRFFWDAYVRAHTVYGLTDQRVLLVRDGRGAGVTSLPLGTLPAITVRRRTVTFGTALGKTPAPAFDDIEDAAEVAELVRRAVAG